MTAPLRDPEILRRALDLFRAVCDLETGEQRRSIEDACGSEPELRAAVEALLLADRAESDPLSDHAIDLASRDTTPDEIDGFKVVGVLGRGGMGIVYDAEQQHPRRRVAIKVIRPGSDSPTLRARVRREAEVLAMLRHPGIAQIHQAGEFNGSPYLVMERVDGVSLADAAARCDLRDRVGLIARIVDAVHHAHQRGIIHRDLKPDNILVNEEAPGRFQPKILDFGIARATDESLRATLADSLTIAEGGSLVGTLAYMSPEQIQGAHDIDVRADVYALGMIAYELLAGARGKDLTGLSVVAAMKAASETTPRPISEHDPRLRGDLETIIGKATDPDRERRYQSAAEFAADLRRHLAREPITARPPSFRYLAGRMISRHRGPVAGVAVAIVAVIAGLIFSTYAATSEHRQRRETEQMLYTSSLAGAVDALEDHDPQRARQMLANAPPSLRGWEWDVLDASIVPGTVLADSGLAFGAFAPNPSTDPDAPGVALAGRYEDHIRVGRFDDEHFTLTHDITPSQSTDDLFRFQFSPSGQTLFVSDLTHGRFISYDTTTWQSREFPVPLVRQSLGPGTVGQRVESQIVDNVACFRTGLTPVLSPIVDNPELGRVFIALAETPNDEGFGISLVSAETRTVLARIRQETQIAKVAWSPDASRLYSVDFSGGLRDNEPGTDHIVGWSPARIATQSPLAFVLSDDGSEAFAAVGESSILRIDTRTGQITQSFPMDDGVAVALFVDTPRNRLLALRITGEIVAYSLDRGGDRFLGHEGAVNPIALTPDGRRLVSGSWDGTLRVWDTSTGELLRTIRIPSADGTPAAVLDLAISPDGTECAIIATPAFWQPVVATRIRLDTGEILDSTTAASHGRATVRYTPDGALNIFGSVFDAAPTDSTLFEFPDTPFAYSRPTRQRPDRLAHAIPGGGIALRSVTTGEELSRFQHPHESLTLIALSPDGRTIALADSKSVVSLYDPTTGKLRGTLKGHAGEVLGVAWSPDGSRIATASRDRTIGIWDAKSDRLLVRLTGHTDYVYDVAWSPDGRSLYTSSGDGTIRVWRSGQHAPRPGP